MDLLSIILEYLEKTPQDGHKYLLDLVKSVGMPRSLIKHIEGCRDLNKVDHMGTYQTISLLGESVQADVNIYTIKSFNPEIPKSESR